MDHKKPPIAPKEKKRSSIFTRFCRSIDSAAAIEPVTIRVAPRPLSSLEIASLIGPQLPPRRHSSVDQPYSQSHTTPTILETSESLEAIGIELETVVSLRSDSPSATQNCYEASRSSSVYFNEDQISLLAEFFSELNERMSNGKRLLAILSAAEKEKWSEKIMNDCQDYLEQLISGAVASETCFRAYDNDALSNFIADFNKLFKESLTEEQRQAACKTIEEIGVNTLGLGISIPRL